MENDEDEQNKVTFSLVYLMISEVEFQNRDILNLLAVNVMRIGSVSHLLPVNESF